MSKKVTGTKLPCFLDEANHRFVIQLPQDDPGFEITIPLVFKSIVSHTNTSWKKLAEFAGLRGSSAAFNVTFVTRKKKLVEALNEYLVIDRAKSQAFFYHHEYKPEGVVAPHIGPVIVNGEPTKTTLFTKIPTKVTSRLTVKDPLNRVLTMTLTPYNGYLLDFNDIRLANPDMKYVIAGSPASLNRLLRTVHFVAVKQGEGSVTISVDDGSKDVASVSSTTVKLQIEQSQEISIPELNIPVDQVIQMNQESSFDPITVSDVDGKLLEFRITPFGASIHGFKNYLRSVNTGEMRTIYGRPEVINAEIANLKIVPYQENAQLGVELICGATRIRQYITFSVEEGTEVLDAEEQNTTCGIAAVEFTGKIGETVPLLNCRMEGTRTFPFTLQITPTGGDLISLTEQGEEVTEAGKTRTVVGTIDEINEMISDLHITIKETPATVSFSFLGFEAVSPGKVLIPVQIPSTIIKASSISASGDFQNKSSTNAGGVFTPKADTLASTLVDNGANVTSIFANGVDVKYYTVELTNGTNGPVAWELYSVNDASEPAKLIGSVEGVTEYGVRYEIPEDDRGLGKYQLVFKGFTQADAPVGVIRVAFYTPEGVKYE